MTDVKERTWADKDTKLSNIVTNNIRAFTAISRLKITQLAKIMGKAQPAISLKFNGLRSWNLNDIEQLSEIFNIEPIEFFKENPEISKINPDVINKRVPRVGFEPTTNGLL